LSLTLTEFTDPGCPWAFSAEPFRLKLSWLYGDQLDWRVRMVGLSETAQESLDKGFTPEVQARAFATIARDHGMPIDTHVRERMAATVPACRAVVAARLHAPERMRPLLRALRVRHFAGELLDARLADWPGGRRYTCPSYELVRDSDGVQISAPGFQPFPVYDVVTANLLPGVERRAAPASVEEVLAWAATPLASQEVATVCDLPLAEAREQLSHVAVKRPVGSDGYWSLREG
jgi:hypothetical protein